MSKGYEKHKSIVRQAVERLHDMAAWGQSKHADKLENHGKPAMNKSYSYQTMDNYKNAAVHFAQWARETHGCRDIDDAKQYTGEYLRQRMDEGKSAWTVRLDAAALAKLYQVQTTELGVDLPARNRADVTQHRTNAEKGHFSEKNNRDLVDLCRATGLRRHEVAALRPEDVKRMPDGRVTVEVQRGKGGKHRIVTALNEKPLIIAQKAAQEGRETVIDHIPKYAPCHVYRREFAKALYDSKARDTSTLTEKEKYRCHAEREGTVYDKAAMKEISFDMRHNRLGVLTS